METVIAILVLAILLTGFLTVFTPAAQGIRRSINTQQADRLQATLERDMSTTRPNETTTFPTGFDKAFTWIRKGNDPATAIFVYQYRGDKKTTRTSDGTLEPMKNASGKKPGEDYVMQTAARRVNDPLLSKDLEAIVGPLFYVIPTQLVTKSNQLVLGTPGKILNSIVPPATSGVEAATPSAYTDAVIPFSAAFFMTPSVSAEYLTGQKFIGKFNLAAAADSKVKPVFIRNLAVRR
jgi:type II secretory pathway pseudopilin PulG